MSGAQIGTNTPDTKAPRAVGGGIHPSGRNMRAMEREAERQIARALDEWRKAGTRDLTEESVAQLATRFSQPDILQPLADALYAVLMRIAVQGAAFGQKQVERYVTGVTKAPPLIPFGFEVDWQAANTDAEKWARTYSNELIRGIDETTRKRVSGLVGDYIANGETLAQLQRRLRDSNSPFSASRARSIAVTETTRAFAAGNIAAWRTSGLVEGKRWNTANDEIVRGCPICAPLDGEQVALDAQFGGRYDHPPAHPRCRCWVSPVVTLPRTAEAERPAPPAPAAVPSAPTLPPALSDEFPWVRVQVDDPLTLPRVPDEIRASILNHANAYTLDDFFAEHYPHIISDLSEMERKIAAETVMRFWQLSQAYPEVVANMEYFGMLSYNVGYIPDWWRMQRAFKTWETDMKASYAFAYRGSPGIGFNPAYFGKQNTARSFLQTLHRSFMSKWHPAEKIDSVVTHEFAHLIDYTLDDLIGAMDVSTIQRKLSILNHVGDISRYAQTNAREAWAETFTAMYENRMLPRSHPAVSIIREFIREYFGGER